MEIEVGTVVVSRAGRDRGRAFLVTALDGSEFVWISDGDLRTIAKPKRKKRKHLNVMPAQAAELAGKLSGGRALDADIRKALTALGYQNGNKQEG